MNGTGTTKVPARRIVVGVLVLLVVAAGAYAGGQPEVSVDDDGMKSVEADGLAFEWRIDDDEIEVTISAPTTGWVSVGFNPERRMAGATYVIGYVDGDEVHVRHDYGNAPTAHRSVVDLGGTSRIRPTGGREANGRTEISFRLPLDPGDEFYAPIVPGSENTIIWAYGSDGAKSFTAYHERRGSFTVEL